MTTEVMVKPATIQEQLLGKIREMRQKNITAKQRREIESYEENLGSMFWELSWRYFGVSKEQIQELSDQEIGALFLLVSERAGKTAIYMRILGFGIPLVGWFAILGDSQTIRFSNSVSKLKRMVGNDFNPVRVIRSQLNQERGKP